MRGGHGLLRRGGRHGPGQRLAGSPHPGAACAAGPAAQGGQPDPGRPGPGDAPLPAAQPDRRAVPQRLLPRAVPRPGPPAGAGDRPAGAGVPPPPGGGGFREPPSGAPHRRGDFGPGPAHRRFGGPAGADRRSGGAYRPVCPAPAGGPSPAPCRTGKGPHRRGPGRGLLLCVRGDPGRAAGRRGGAGGVQPLKRPGLPEGTGGLYLPGGYPELHAEALAANGPCAGRCGRRWSRPAHGGGVRGLPLPGTEFGGPGGRPCPMAGVLPGRGLPRRGWCASATPHSPQKGTACSFAKGSRHRSTSSTTGTHGQRGRLRRGKTRDRQGLGLRFATPSLYAAFPHLYFAGEPELAVRFVQAAARYREGQRERKGQG